MAEWDDAAALVALEEVERSRTSTTTKNASKSKASGSTKPSAVKLSTAKKKKVVAEDDDDPFVDSAQDDDESGFQAEDSTSGSAGNDPEEEDDEDFEGSDDGEDEKPVAKKARIAKKDDDAADEKPKKPRNKTAKKSVAAAATKLSGSPTTSVMDYLRQKNRPYSAAVLVPNLGNEIGMAKMKKILEDGVKSGDLWESGDTGKVYYPNQDKMPQCSTAELEALNKDCRLLEDEIQQLQREKEKKLGVVFRLENAPSDKDLPAICNQMQQGLAAQESELEQYGQRMATLPIDKPLNVADLRTEVEFWTAKCKVLRQPVIALFRGMSEATNRDWKDIAEEAGIVMD